ncbi:basic salivary proline-rich protein 2-like [Lontra canadensis]|uniref:basic salivary proline-rich protein 2-like n=1 Tax=Lontra canadensis TaxID=76717 RepID=UPI0013F36922|nr:basic salivary proline-rich protein 2-like [Lontra canadensis]
MCAEAAPADSWSEAALSACTSPAASLAHERSPELGVPRLRPRSEASGPLRSPPSRAGSRSSPLEGAGGGGWSDRPQPARARGGSRRRRLQGWWDADSYGPRAERKQPIRALHQLISILKTIAKKKKKEKKTEKPLLGLHPGQLWPAEPTGGSGFWEQLARVPRGKREEKQEALGPIPELTVTPPGDPRAAERAHGEEGTVAARYGPGPALRGLETRAGQEPPASTRASPRQALFPRTPDPCFPNTSPILRPSSSPDFFPGGGRARMQRPPLGRPQGSREAWPLAPPRPGSPGGVQSWRAWQARAAARGRQVEGPPRWAHSSGPPPPPSPQPRIPLACAAGSSRCGRLRAGTGPGSQLPARGPRRASGYPGAGVSRPIGARGDSALDGCARRPVFRYH